MERVYSKEILPTWSFFLFCLEVVRLLILRTTPQISNGQVPCRARKPRRSSGW